MMLLSIFVVPLLLSELVVSENRTEDQSLDVLSSDEPRLETAAAHQASVRRRRKDSYRFGVGHICGGSLISRNVVLTAAHCFIDQSKYDGTFLSKSDFIVVLGARNRFGKTEDTLIFGIKELILQMSKFNLSTYSKDMALTVLKGSICHFDISIKPIPLSDASLSSNTSCQLTGWANHERIIHVDMLFILSVSLNSNEECWQLTDASQSERKCAGLLTELMPDTCTMDTGAPITCSGRLAGIVSWGTQCGDSSMPAVYTDVAYHRMWIDGAIAKFPPDAGFHCTGIPQASQKKDDPRSHPIKKSSAAFNSPFRPSLWSVVVVAAHCVFNLKAAQVAESVVRGE